MATSTTRGATSGPAVTVEQWGELQGPPHFDLVEGRLREKPDVAFWHELLLQALNLLIGPHVLRHRLGKIVVSRAKLRISAFGGREPDLFFIPADQDHLIGKTVFKGIPPLVIEIVSPSNEHEDRVEKRLEYAQLGVGEYWIVDFARRRVEVYRLRRDPAGADYELAETVAGDAILRPALFPGLEIRLAEVWPAEYENRTD